MVLLTAGSCLLFPRITINEDMTEYLPSDSRMRQGLDSLKTYFPEIDLNAYWIKAMFTSVPDKDARGAELSAFEGVAGITAVSEKDSCTLYQLSVAEGADPKRISEQISERYAGEVVVENNANSIMPDNMGMILMVGVAIVFGILFLMCSSIVEALLFLVAIGMAVLINMGTNAFLPSVSMVTSSIAAVLQLVLSMDYSIILMNRFRQTLQVEEDLDKALSLAVRDSSPSILSSSFTTIVGLLALVFMKFKIGLDLGVVLAKGVFCSLVAVYTVLPALILLFFKGIKATEKKVPLIPTDGLSRFEMRFRVPLAIVFVCLFFASWYLSRRTELSYASVWESEIEEVFPPQNLFSLLYRTECGENVIALMDTVCSDRRVVTAVSYPSLFQKKLTAPQMCEQVGSLLAMMPSSSELPLDVSLLSEDNLRILYYACTHPERNERMSLAQMLQLAEDASSSGLVPEGMDVQKMVRKFTSPQPVRKPSESRASVPEAPAEESQADVPANQLPESSTAPVPADSAATSGVLPDSLSTIQADSASAAQTQTVPVSRFTKENISVQLTSSQMAAFLGFTPAQASSAYSLAGKKGGTMSAYEFITYMTGSVLKNKMLRKMMGEDQARELLATKEEMELVLNAPEAESPAQGGLAEPYAAVTGSGLTADAGSVQGKAASDTGIPEAFPSGAPAIRDSLTAAAPVGAVRTAPEVEEEEPTPLEVLAGMFASGRKYSSKQIYNALRRAGIREVDRNMLDLMFLYWGSRNNYDETTALSVEQLIDFLSTEVASGELWSGFVDEESRKMLGGLKTSVNEGLGALRKDRWSMAAIVSEYPVESEETFDFVQRTLEECSGALGEDCYLIGESVMYKEMKDGFKRELLFLTLLTVFAIFLIVALTFKSLLIPVILVMTVMTGVFVNVFFSGVGGHTMLYLAYLIVQSILMGATIDYGILFTNYYRGFRRTGHCKSESLMLSYRGSIHTIMTSGMIIIFAPYIMSVLLTDPTICSILSSLTFGALAAIGLILLVLPAMLAACDRFVRDR